MKSSAVVISALYELPSPSHTPNKYGGIEYSCVTPSIPALQGIAWLARLSLTVSVLYMSLVVLTVPYGVGSYTYLRALLRCVVTLLRIVPTATALDLRRSRLAA